ncbi:pirin family protein [uncultured Aquimarina sp.]|uniref:pirin family protein n=1 Tax=uncultured Aquimarina sp. TaxID=575652 RepID=UPI002614413B|nr:pirin family protein [uncultured Aquimarina sp.]
MELHIKSKLEQKGISLFGGRLQENKPLSGEPLYSNLIYWANVDAIEEGAFPMHPHEGIEILTFIFDGGLEHYDTATNKWTPLPADGVQHIKAGSGLQHSEKYWKGSRAFQIWFDPDFSKSLQKAPYYKDYQANSFQWKNENDYEVKSYAGEDAPIQTDAPGIFAKRYKLPKGNHTINLDKNSFHSFYLMEGGLEIEGNEMLKDSFTKTNNIEQVNLNVTQNSELFILQSPVQVSYKKVTDR